MFNTSIVEEDRGIYVYDPLMSLESIGWFDDSVGMKPGVLPWWLTQAERHAHNSCPLGGWLFIKLQQKFAQLPPNCFCEFRFDNLCTVSACLHGLARTRGLFYARAWRVMVARR